jgi:hypothetical protein
MAASLRGCSAGSAPDPWNTDAARGALNVLRTIEDYGYLRMARNAAVALQSGHESPNVSRAEFLKRFRHALLNIDDAVADALAPIEDLASWACAYSLIDELYVSVMSKVASPTLARDLHEWTLARAVAISANFPPVLPPYKVDGLFEDTYVSRLGLTDGGVFENSGVQALIDEDCNCLIVSDSSSPFRPRRRASVGRMWMMRRITDALMTGVSWRQRSHVNALWNAREIQSYAWIDIDGPPRETRVGPSTASGMELDGHALARVRTDLDIFGDVEMAALINHGYHRADSYLRRYVVHDGAFKEAANVAPVPVPPFQMTVSPDEVERILQVGRSRGGRALRLYVPATIIATCVGVALVAALGLNARWLFEVGLVLARQYPTAWKLVSWHAPAWVTLVCVLVAVTASALELERLNLSGWLNRRGKRRQASVVAMLTDRGRGLSYNLLWLLPPFPLPVWISLLVSCGAWLKYFTFSLPFARATRMPLASPRGPLTSEH